MTFNYTRTCIQDFKTFKYKSMNPRVKIFKSRNVHARVQDFKSRNMHWIGICIGREYDSKNIKLFKYNKRH
jgi:hypothetical protein